MLALALAGSWLGLLVAGRATTEIGPLLTTTRLQPLGDGQTTVDIAPLGTLKLDTHGGPAGLQIAIRSIDLPAARSLFADPERLENLEAELRKDLQNDLAQAAMRSLIVSVLGALILGGVVLRSRRETIIVGGIALGLVVGSFGIAALTYNPKAINEPKFTGLLTSAPQLVGKVSDISANISLYAAQLGKIVSNVTELYNTSLSLPTFQPQPDTIRVLHVSDLHLSPTAWDVIDSVAKQYDVDVIVDTGDIADHGTAPESRYVRGIAQLGRPYVYVRGNHDSVLTEAAVAEQPDTVVLDGEVVEVAGLRFFGAPDPRFTPDQLTRGKASARLRAATEELADAARAFDPATDVIVFHDPTNAQLFDGAAPLVLSGHAHRRSNVVLPEGTRVMVQGSTGGAGLRALEGEEPTPVMLSVLYFDASSKRLQAWDDITLGGLGLTSAQIERHQAGQEAPAPAENETPGPPVLEN